MSSRPPITPAKWGPSRTTPPNAITGRAGLFPSRYQSDRVDRFNGPLVRRANRALRAAILGIADNLMLCNRHFRQLAAAWKTAGKDPRKSHVKVGLRFCRISYHMVAGRQVFRHPSLRERGYLLDKLVAFHLEHETPQAAWALVLPGQWRRKESAPPLGRGPVLQIGVRLA